MTATQSRYYDTLDAIRTIHDQFPDGIDPDFDGDLADLEYQLGELRFLSLEEAQQFAATFN
jgi:hypothetical protein